MKFKLFTEILCAQHAESELIKITDLVKARVAEAGIENGIVFIITPHTTTGITVNEGLPCVEKDMLELMDRSAPEDFPYHHNHFLLSYCAIGGNAPGHLKSMLTGNHTVFPLLGGQLVIGDMQDIYFAEYDGVKNRKFHIYIMGE